MVAQMFQDSDHMRRDFSNALSDMYRREVPAYGTLIDIVAEINAVDGEKIDSDARLGGERHGAIRLGTSAELNLIGRVFAQLGMHPVGYYDLSVAGLPVHSTAFRPITPEAFEISPFRMFTSLLRLEMIEDASLRDAAETALATRQIVSARGLELLHKAETQGGLNAKDATEFVAEIVAIFAWRAEAHVTLDLYQKLLEAHPLIADIVSFQGPHMNHLTPRVRDIDAAQDAMRDAGLEAKSVIEGPPKRNCPILLRQTAFKALSEPVKFQTAYGWETAHHTARFGEIEQRGAALTPKGRTLYDRCLSAKDFTDFPDDWAQMAAQGLAYFRDGNPVTYEDFLPVSAAGIFRSNLGSEARELSEGNANQNAFEAALGRPVFDMFELYKAVGVAA
ncbi:2-oxoadipate dioxygenase/decarboxylase family protein [Litorimonas sp. RW-G-Af-16]|uniref:2-oxoadipate dioxygenase/decarboxylase family protein n=1 Tax=Litorimonas sp. RW-G-Af-16 TaxID=3241168 RepID=UPI00390C973F